MFRVGRMVRSSYTQDGGTLLDVEHGRMFGLNPVGSRIFLLLEQGSSESDIAADIGELFGVLPDIAEADVRRFLKALEQQDLVRRVSDGGR